MEKSSKIYVAGHRGLVGSALLRHLKNKGFNNLILKTHAELDLTHQQSVDNFFSVQKPEYVFLSAAKVGGIYANDIYRADFIYQNLAIQLNVIEAARKYSVKRLLFLGSSCIYPRDCKQPMQETDLLSGYLEQTNEPYAIAKIAGIKMCEAYNKQYTTDFISVMPTNLYGPHDNFDLQESHVLPALIRKIHTAKENNDASVCIWGTGNPRREFLHVDDMADACLFVMQQKNDLDMVNIGSGQEVTIHALAESICDVIGYQGFLVFDPGKPDGTPRKLLDSTKINALGWHAKISLTEGIAQTYNWFLQSEACKSVAR
ncbi:MAG TPA: GDP-L-fucose synthase [Coxiellaceae bacterium]|nr:MAG: GDP-fucose synthetase [Gammaproteobacteria bacterium RIFCSPHIGHO2_12_FULL_36_30]HLB55914.1 GDP-L-fucose synthase [Coxiellaceae bacterium]